MNMSIIANDRISAPPQPQHELLNSASRAPLRIVHGLLSMDVGGLERNVLNQVRLAPTVGQEVVLVCLERAGSLARQAEALGARVISMNKRPGLRWELLP